MKQNKHKRKTNKIYIVILLLLFVIIAFQYNKIRSFQKDNSFLRETIASLNQENDELKNSTPDSQKEEISSLENKLTTAEETQSSLEKEISSLKDENQALEKEIASLKSEKTSLEEENTSLTTENESLEETASNSSQDFWDLFFWEDPYNYKIEAGHVYSDVDCKHELDITEVDTNVYLDCPFMAQNLEDGLPYIYRANGRFVFSPEKLVLSYNEPSDE